VTFKSFTGIIIIIHINGGIHVCYKWGAGYCSKGKHVIIKYHQVNARHPQHNAEILHQQVLWCVVVLEVN
jgi:hypothetical protein